VLSTSTKSYQRAFKAGIGWDFPTGLGTPNVNDLVLGWPRLRELSGVFVAGTSSGRQEKQSNPEPGFLQRSGRYNAMGCCRVGFASASKPRASGM
jgi:hypothetical protein